VYTGAYLLLKVPMSVLIPFRFPAFSCSDEEDYESDDSWLVRDYEDEDMARRRKARRYLPPLPSFLPPPFLPSLPPCQLILPPPPRLMILHSDRASLHSSSLPFIPPSFPPSHPPSLL